MLCSGKGNRNRESRTSATQWPVGSATPVSYTHDAKRENACPNRGEDLRKRRVMQRNLRGQCGREEASCSLPFPESQMELRHFFMWPGQPAGLLPPAGGLTASSAPQTRAVASLPGPEKP